LVCEWFQGKPIEWKNNPLAKRLANFSTRLFQPV